MHRAQLLEWAAGHGDWTADAWCRGDAASWISAFDEDVVAHIRRRMGPESYRGRDRLAEVGWGLREFFPLERTTVVEVTPPSVVLYHIEMLNESGDVVGIYIAHRLNRDGLVAELIVHDDDEPLDHVRSEVDRLARFSSGTEGEP